MSKLERITVTLTKEMAAKLKEAVDSGEYATTSEIVREALRDWEEYQERQEEKMRWLREEIQKGIDSPMLDGEQVLDELRDYVRKLVDEQRNNKAA